MQYRFYSNINIGLSLILIKSYGDVMKGWCIKNVGIGLVLTQMLFVSTQATATEVVNVYSARKEALIKPLLDRFTAQTGIVTKLVTAKADALLKRLELEGSATPADIFITTDAGRLQRAKEAKVLQAISSELLQAVIPAHLRDTNNQWFGLSQRSRVIFYAADRVSVNELSTYEDLVNPKWKGRICIRSSSNIYNQSLIASMIVANGEEAAETWAKGLVANFARPPSGGDTDQIRAAAAGVCDIAIANTYYFGRLVKSDKPEDQEVVSRLKVFWPNQADNQRGAHMNVSGIGVTAYSKHKNNATKLVEFLVSEESQQWYGDVNNEYPVVAGVPMSGTLKDFGGFKKDTLELSLLGKNNRTAVEIMDRAGWK